MRKIILVAFCLCLSGCIALAAGGAAAGAGAVAYLNGNYTVTENANIDTVWDASLEAISDIGYGIKSKKRDALRGAIEGIGSDGTSLSIKVSREEEKETELIIRFGMIGDKSDSEYLYQKIKSRL